MEYALTIIVIVSAAVAAVASWLWGRRAGRLRQSQLPPSQLPTDSSRPVATVDLFSLPDLSQSDSEEDGAPPSDIDITMMGAVPNDFLEELELNLEASKAEKPEEEISVDIDLDGMDDEFYGDEPTHPHALILATGIARTDRGRKRPCNEDAFLMMEDVPLFVVADGMGGHAAGDVASQLAAEVIAKAFRTKTFVGPSHKGWPRRGDELARALHMANKEVFDRSQSDQALAGMGTTVVAARFARNKQRVYIANVGDSRCYRIRHGELRLLTQDHTLGAVLGITGRRAKHLTQSVGVRSWISVDLFADRPEPNDLYLICSDGLTKMVADEGILEIADSTSDLEGKCQALVDHANARGGRDNITVIGIRVDQPADVAKAVEQQKG